MDTTETWTCCGGIPLQLDQSCMFERMTINTNNNFYINNFGNSRIFT